MTAKLCIVCNTRRPSRNNGRDFADMCGACYQESGWENTHSDGNHDGIQAVIENKGIDGLSPADASELPHMDGCWICHPELNLATRPAKTGHTNTATKGVHRSHAACAHPRTPKDRAACRKAGGPKN